MLRAAVRSGAALALGLLLLAGCTPSTPSLGVDGNHPFGDGTIAIAVGIADLRPAVLDSALARHATGRPGRISRDVFVSGTGLEAAASVLTGRDALDVLRVPGPVAATWRAVGASFALRGVSPALRSAHHFDTLFDADHVIDPTQVGSIEITTDVDVQAVLLDGIGEPDSLLAAVAAWRAVDPGRVRVHVFGFPTQVDDPRRDLRVSVYSWEPTHRETGPRTAAEILWAPAPGALPSFLTAAWPGIGDGSGGVFATTGDLSMWSGPEGFAFDVAPGKDSPEARDALLEDLAGQLFGGTPRAWIAVRGSASVDFVDLSVLAHQPLAGRVTPWALEDIDTRWDPNENALRFSLGAEDRGDGLVLDLGWPPFRFDVRLTGALAEGSWLGPPMYLGPSRQSWGFRGLVVEPWSRAFWLATAGTWPDAADDWWPAAPVGVHVMIDGAADVPAPAVLDDAR